MAIISYSHRKKTCNNIHIEVPQDASCKKRVRAFPASAPKSGHAVPTYMQFLVDWLGRQSQDAI